MTGGSAFPRYPDDYRGWAIVSSAGESIRSVLAADGFAAAVADVLAVEDDLSRETDAVSQALHRLVPIVVDSTARRKVIDARRRLYNRRSLTPAQAGTVRDLARRHLAPEQAVAVTRSIEWARSRADGLDRIDRLSSEALAATRRTLSRLRWDSRHPINLGIAFSAPALWSDLSRADALDAGQTTRAGSLSRIERAYLAYLVRAVTKSSGYSTFSDIHELGERRETSGCVGGDGPVRIVEVNLALAELALDAMVRRAPEVFGRDLRVSRYLNGGTTGPDSLRWPAVSGAVAAGRSVRRARMDLLAASRASVRRMTDGRDPQALGSGVGLGVLVRGPGAFGFEAAIAVIGRADPRDRVVDPTGFEALMSACRRIPGSSAGDRAELVAGARRVADEVTTALGSADPVAIDPVLYEASYGGSMRSEQAIPPDAPADLRRLESILPIFDPLCRLRTVARQRFDRIAAHGRCSALEFVFDLADTMRRDDSLRRGGLLSGGHAPAEEATASSNCDRDVRAAMREEYDTGADEIRLRLDRLTSIAGRPDLASWHPVDDYAFQIHPIADGTVVVDAAMDGWGRHLSRYRHPRSPDDCRRHYVRLPTVPGCEYVELSGQLGFNGNVVCDRGMRLLLMPGDEADPRAVRGIPLSRISVEADGDRLCLVEDGSESRLLPLYLGTLATPRLPTLHQAMLPFTQFYWSDLPIHRIVHPKPAGDTVVAMPRLVLGRAVVARRRWWVPAAAWPWWGLSTPPGAADHVALGRWRRIHRMPPEVYIRRHVPGAGGGRRAKPQYVGFESPAALHVAWRRFHDVPSDLVVEEALPTTLDGPDARPPLGGRSITVIVEGDRDRDGG